VWLRERVEGACSSKGHKMDDRAKLVVALYQYQCSHALTVDALTLDRMAVGASRETGPYRPSQMPSSGCGRHWRVSVFYTRVVDATPAMRHFSHRKFVLASWRSESKRCSDRRPGACC